MTDKDIIVLVLLKKPAGAEALYDRYCRGIWLAIIRIATDKATAEAALERTFIAVWRDMADHDPQAEKLFTFMIRIAKEQARLLVREYKQALV